MSAMKEYATGVCCAHPKTMFNLLDLLCGDAQARMHLQQAEDVVNKGADLPGGGHQAVVNAIVAILAPLPRCLDRLAMLGYVQGIAAWGEASMAEERRYWEGRCFA